MTPKRFREEETGEMWERYIDCPDPDYAYIRRARKPTNSALERWISSWAAEKTGEEAEYARAACKKMFDSLQLVPLEIGDHPETAIKVCNHLKRFIEGDK